MHHSGDSVTPTAEISSFGNSFPSPSTPGSGILCVWGDHTMGLREILADNPLPQIVKICEEDVVQSNGDGVDGFNFRQPLLLYKEVKPTRIFARNVIRSTGPRAREREVGPYVVIPSTYEGLFKPADDSAEDTSLTALSTVARIMPGSFLSTRKIKGFVALHKRNSTTVYEKHEIPPGVFYFLNIHEDQITYISNRKHEKRKLLLCLRCACAEKEVLLPYDTVGQFFIVDLKKNSSKAQLEKGACVYRISTVIENFARMKDSKLELIFGDPPSQECQFSGVIRLSHVTKEHAVISCTLNTSEPKILELAVSQYPKFKLALQTADKHSDDVRKKCLSFMRSTCDKFSRDLKIRRDYEIEKRDLREDY